jgi:AAA+ ATPase superfamily predicted ATPase
MTAEARYDVFLSLESGHTTPVAQLVESDLSTFIGPVFEDLCRDWVVEQAALGGLPFLPERVGAWWDGQEEIDVVAAGADAVLLGECKWTGRPVGTNILDDLKRKTHPLVRSAGWRSMHYALFARAGFTPALRARGQFAG